MKRASIAISLLGLAGLLPTLAVAQQAAAPVVTQAPVTDPIDLARAELATQEAAHPGNTEEVSRALILLSQRLRISVKHGPEALEVGQKAVSVAEAAAGKDSIVYAKALANLAKIYDALDHAETGRPLAEQALEIARRKSPGTHEMAEVADALGQLCLNLRDFPCALRADEEAVAAERASHNEYELYLASMLQDLAELRLHTGDREGTRAAMLESMTIVERQPKPTPAMAVLESNAGAFFNSVSQPEEAFVHLKKALEYSVAIYGEDSVQVARSSEFLGSYYTTVDNFPEAKVQFEKSLALCRKWYGPTHTWTARLEASYSYVLAATGNYTAAMEMALHAHKSQREYFSLAIRVMPERQALALERNNHYSLDIALSLLARHSEIEPTVLYQEEVRSRSLVAEEMAQRQASLNRTNNPEIADLLSSLDKERTTLLAAHEAKKEGTDPSQQLFDATNRMEHIERALAERSQTFRVNQRTRSVDLQDIRQQLPKDSVLISYVSYNRIPYDTKGIKDGHPLWYMAFVMHPDSGKIHVYDLGDAKNINEFVSSARAAADAEAHSGGLGSVRNERAYRDAAQNLRQRIWDPLQSELANAKLVLVVPDGMLNLIPFSSLPDGDGYMVEHSPVIHILTSERDLVPADAVDKKHGLLAIGSPSFQQAQNKLPQSPLRGTQPSCDAFNRVEFQPLPAAAAEVADIGTAWKQWNALESEQLITGDDATLARFLTESTHNRVLHVATHAFLLDKSCGDGNPLLHSGLVFAGANQSHDSSILTAQQIASLDLNGVDWAVLSACNTGNGELHDGEGVLGLERAFRVAGARSVVMTLWPVDDEVTRHYMHELYAQRLGQHASTADSVWNAARILMLERRAAGKSTNPWYWAGFVGSGGWE
jgi:CHAT domain-containing protein